SNCGGERGGRGRSLYLGRGCSCGLWPVGKKKATPDKTTPGRSDHLGSVPRLEPTDRRVIDGVGKRNLAQRLTCCHMLQGFARLMLGQLRLPAKSYAFGHGASAAFVSPLQDQAALKFSDAGQHGQHETAMRSRSVGPRIAERLEASAFLADQVDDPQQVERRARQPVELGHDQDVANLKLIERALQFRSLGGNAGHLLAEYPLSACGQEQRLLRRQSLPGR